MRLIPTNARAVGGVQVCAHRSVRPREDFLPHRHSFPSIGAMYFATDMHFLSQTCTRFTEHSTAKVTGNGFRVNRFVSRRFEDKSCPSLMLPNWNSILYIPYLPPRPHLAFLFIIVSTYSEYKMIIPAQHYLTPLKILMATNSYCAKPPPVLPILFFR